MKRIFTLLAIFAFGLTAFAQDNLNMMLRSNLQYPQDLNDIWGWADPDDGTEYALVGTRTGFSIVSLADPDNAEEVAFIDGPSTTWRDIKTWKNFAYVSNEEAEGILVVDLSQLPDTFTYERWEPEIPEIGGQLATVHNLYIDERGIMYIAGANLNDGGLILADVDTEPGKPVVVGWNEPTYTHDVYVRGGLAYDAQIYEGHVAVIDVSDVDSLVTLATQSTPFDFTHNTWLSDDGNVVYTTDERANAPVAAYDVSDLDDIKFLDEYRPVATVGSGVIPHNVHVWEDWLLISYYTDGGRVVDASRPTNLIEVASFDTWLTSDGGFDGAWGLYPFLPSGTILVSDIGNGLYVLTPNLVRACWLEGVVVEEGTNTPLSDVTIEIDTDQANLGVSASEGTFETGIATPGTYDVTFAKAGYVTKTISVDLENGVLTEVTIELEPLPKFQASGRVVRKSDGVGIENAIVLLVSDQNSVQTRTDTSGGYAIETFSDTYRVLVGAWGFRHETTLINLDNNLAQDIELESGYQDDFVFDFGWSTDNGQASSGFWVREDPVGTNVNIGFANPEDDLGFDLGAECYMTGNGGGNSGTDDVDDGSVSLTTPLMDLTAYDFPTLNFFHWFYNVDRGGAPRNDDLTIMANNGIEEVQILMTDEVVVNWTANSINLKDFLAITDSMTLTFIASDPSPGHVTEAAIDGFEIIEGMPSSSDNILLSAKMNAFPNPFGATMNFNYELEEAGATLIVKNLLGQEIEQHILNGANGALTLGAAWQPGVYFAKISKDDQESEVLKLIKQ